VLDNYRIINKTSEVGSWPSNTAIGGDDVAEPATVLAVVCTRLPPLRYTVSEIVPLATGNE